MQQAQKTYLNKFRYELNCIQQDLKLNSTVCGEYFHFYIKPELLIVRLFQEPNDEGPSAFPPRLIRMERHSPPSATDGEQNDKRGTTSVGFYS